MTPGEIAAWHRTKRASKSSYQLQYAPGGAYPLGIGISLQFAFIWLRQHAVAAEAHIFPVTTQTVNIIDNIKAYQREYPTAECSLWYDAATVTGPQLVATKSALPGVELKPLGVFAARINTGTPPLMYRIDTLKLLLQAETLETKTPGAVLCIVDLDIPPRALNTAFTRYNIDRLRKFGVMWAWKDMSNNEIENGVSFAAVQPADAWAMPVAKETIRIALYLADARRTHCNTKSALSNAVYLSIINAVTWMTGQHYANDECNSIVRAEYASPARDSHLVNHPCDARRDLAPTQSVPYNPFSIAGATPTVADLAPLIIELRAASTDAHQATYEDTMDAWFVVTSHPILGIQDYVSSDGAAAFQLVDVPIKQLRRYHEMPESLIPVMFISVGVTKGADSWALADAGLPST